MKGEASEAIVRGMKAAGVDLVAILPDHGFDRVQKRIAEDDSFTVVPVSNEAVGVGVCAGAFFGGKSPALMIPTSGFLVATWPLASLHNLWNIPLLLLIPYRGDIGDAFSVMRTYKFTTEPILDALGISLRHRPPNCRGGAGHQRCGGLGVCVAESHLCAFSGETLR